MELLQLKYFCDAAQSENFSKTAKKFLVPTSNISQSIKRLERELGKELFEHKANKIRLNNDGKEFYSSVSKALSLLEEGITCLLDKGEELYGDIKLLCLSNRRIVTRAVELFARKHSDVNFVIHHNVEENSDYDVIISDICPYEYSEKILLLDEEIAISVNERHFLAGKNRVSVSDLENERFITMTMGSSLQRITVNACAEAGFVPNITIQTDDPYYLRKYVEMGLGVAFVPTVSWQGLFSEKAVLKKIENMRRRTYAFLPKNKYVNRAVKMFLEMLTNEIEISLEKE